MVMGDQWTVRLGKLNVMTATASVQLFTTAQVAVMLTLDILLSSCSGQYYYNATMFLSNLTKIDFAIDLVHIHCIGTTNFYQCRDSFQILTIIELALTIYSVALYCV